MNNTYISQAEALESLRLENGFTKKYVAECLGCRNNYYAMCESGARNLTIQQLEQACYLYGVDASILDPDNTAAGVEDRRKKDKENFFAFNSRTIKTVDTVLPKDDKVSNPFETEEYYTKVIKMGNDYIKETEKLKYIFEKQKEYENYLSEKYKISFNDVSVFQIQRALLDEIGEVNHELKASWCWWKLTQSPVNKSKVLEELADCIHFALSVVLHYGDMETCIQETALHRSYIKDLKTLYSNLASSVFNTYSINFILKYIFDFAEGLGYTRPELYESYINKNRINMERVKNGY